ncbi:unnamed protein product [Darwinula stevensoni]|uniref:Uncharacterized protein n=1 Tax=Darwinula stevensoni TaxID=69355 RepID=A0A7R9FNV3_9CRUS|nr:unnamed protein product [Darwinula stevensoni]CAG0897237.1 unnamed protein product [Darwinula stevensoni]
MVNRMPGWLDFMSIALAFILLWSRVASADFCGFEKNKADCHFSYEGIEVNVKGVVNEDLGNLDSLTVTFNFNIEFKGASPSNWCQSSEADPL